MSKKYSRRKIQVKYLAGECVDNYEKEVVIYLTLLHKIS